MKYYIPLNIRMPDFTKTDHASVDEDVETLMYFLWKCKPLWKVVTLDIHLNISSNHSILRK